ncbi:hypothetical protein DFH06DRAFT_1337399 [Mycena polygramma]|nr:hypothetical protein DFH06DRAFT_1337399 [Mycena polygramma]
MSPAHPASIAQPAAGHPPASHPLGETSCNFSSLPPAPHSKHQRKRQKAHKKSQATDTPNVVQKRESRKRVKGAGVGTGKGSLEVLTDTTRRALVALPSRRIELPDGAGATTQQANGRTFGELVERGKSHFSYAIVAILHKRLPAEVLSRGSLTLIRQVLVCRKSLDILKEKINPPPAIRKPKVLETFFASFGDVSKKLSTEGVQQYLTVALGAVFGAVCDKGRE